MTSTMNLLHDQEVRRQAMLQAMQLDVWLPRQQLVNAAASRDYLLEWHSVKAVAAAVEPAVVAQPSVAPRVAAAVAPTVAVALTTPTAPRADAWVSIRDKMALTQTAQRPAVVASVVPEAVAAQEIPAVTVVQAEPIPRFALQLLRADNCLLLVDLPTGEAFQSRDPDYQLLKDMLRAAGLTDQPDFMRQAAPITWPMLHSGNLVHEQNAAAARACVRDLLTVELQSKPAVCIWLLGKQAVRFASSADDADLYSVQSFVEGAQLWSLPSLESILEQPLLKRDIWRSMCKERSLWQAVND